MFRTLILTWCLLQILDADNRSRGMWKLSNRDCLTGYMTDVQDWVDEYGNLSSNLDYNTMIDVSSMPDPAESLQKKMISLHNKNVVSQIKYLSMSNCNLKRVPSVFNLSDRRGRALYSTVEYLTLYGNDFATISTSGVAFSENMNATNAIQYSNVDIRWPGIASWAGGLNEVTFSRLREFDLRRCHIQHLNDYLFITMPMLEALYLGENQITFVSVRAFARLFNLKHLDMSRNFDGDDDKTIVFEHRNVLKVLTSLQSLDLSKTVMMQQDAYIFKDLDNLTRLSICYAGLTQLPEGFFKDSSIKYLDVSGNNGILSRRRPFEGLRRSLEVVYARETGLRCFDIFENLNKLEIIDLEGNEINEVESIITKSLSNLKVLNLNKNRITTWFDFTYSYMDNLVMLLLQENNINMISKEMIEDFHNVTFVGLSGNFFVCNCHTREFFEIAYRNENETKTKLLGQDTIGTKSFNFHRGYIDINNLIEKRQKTVRECQENQTCRSEEDIDAEGNFLLIDFDEDLYTCVQITETKSVPFYEGQTCAQMKMEPDYLDVIEESRTQIIVLVVIPVVVFPILIFCYVFRRNFKYFWITIRNSATLSMLNNNEVIINDNTIFHYDVFVSYCHDDRNWMLDEFLPNIERDCNISVCLHERDFQVGLSILENIVSCMDRSRSIMLVISKQFLMSQWCQFEMHLAQHRLLETRREDLILVLLEDIPRRLRPTTLHYLMLTKTYILWPKKSGEHSAFWKRLTKSILARRQLTQNNVSLV